MTGEGAGLESRSQQARTTSETSGCLLPRRKWLASVGTTGILALAGCVGDDDGLDDSDGDTGDDGPSGDDGTSPDGVDDTGDDVADETADDGTVDDDTADDGTDEETTDDGPPATGEGGSGTFTVGGDTFEFDVIYCRWGDETEDDSTAFELLGHVDGDVSQTIEVIRVEDGDDQYDDVTLLLGMDGSGASPEGTSRFLEFDGDGFSGTTDFIYDDSFGVEGTIEAHCS